MKKILVFLVGSCFSGFANSLDQFGSSGVPDGRALVCLITRSEGIQGTKVLLSPDPSGDRALKVVVMDDFKPVIVLTLWPQSGNKSGYKQTFSSRQFTLSWGISKIQLLGSWDFSAESSQGPSSSNSGLGNRSVIVEGEECSDFDGSILENSSGE